MLEGVDKATLEEWAKECKKKFYKKFVETLQKPMLGEIGTNAQMIEELKSLNYQYLDEMGDYADEPVDDIDGGFIRHFENAEKEGKNVILEAQECPRIWNIVYSRSSKEENDILLVFITRFV